MIDRSYIKGFCQAEGAACVGVASVTSFSEGEGIRHPSLVLPSCRSVVIFAFELPVETLYYTSEHYTIVRNLLVEKSNTTAKKLEMEIKTLGLKAKAIPSTGGSYRNNKFMGPISLKHAGEYAGIGIIGRNYLLANEKLGNRMWLGGVVTELEIEPDSTYAGQDICSSCGVCVQNCPSGALEMKGSFDHLSCRRTCYKTIKGKLDLQCWQCRISCPELR